MKIGIEAQRIFRKKKHGMEIVTVKLIRELQRIDKTNNFVIFVKDDVDSSCIEETENFKIVKVPGFSYADWEQIHLPIAAKKEKLDLIHFTSNTASLFLDIPKILTLHDIIYLESISFSGSSYQNIGNLYRRFIVPKIIKDCKKIITVSQYEKKRIKNHLNLDAANIQVVYNGIEPSFKKINDLEFLKSIQERYDLPSEFILFLGNTAPKKNTKGMLSAYNKYCHEHTDALPLVIVDLAIENIIKILEDIDALACKDKIIAQSYISHNDMAALYNLANIFVYPSLRESFGLPIIEAMACGTPVITSNTSSMPEVAGDAALLIDPYKSEEIASALSKITYNHEFRRKQIEKGFSQAEIFNWKRTAEQTRDIYISTVGNRSCTAPFNV